MNPHQRAIARTFCIMSVLLVLSSCFFDVWQARRADMIIEHVTPVKIDEGITLVTVDQVPDVVVVIDERPGSDPVRVTRVRPSPPPKAAPPREQPAAPKAHAWTLPYSCADVKYYDTHFTKTQLEAMRKAANLAVPTREQMTEINECRGHD